MRPASPDTPSTRSHTPRAFTVFAAAFVAGAAAAVGVNSLLDVRLAQAKPRVESEPIFVALRSLPQGAPVTVWDVALRDWPRAMVPTSALRASDAFSGLVLKHPLREGQPLLSIQLVEADATTPSSSAPMTTISAAAAPAAAHVPDADLWAPAAPATVSAAAAPEQRTQVEPQPSRPVVPQPRGPEQSAGSTPITDIAAPTMAAAPTTTASTAMPAVPPAASPAAPPAASPAAPPAASPVASAVAPSTDEVAATARDAEPAVAVTDMPQAASETTVAAAPQVDEAFTDEILEAMAATTAPQAGAFVAQPDEAVIAVPAVAATPSDRVTSQQPIAAGPDAADAAPAEDVVAMPPAPTLADPPLASIGGEPTADDDGAAKSVLRPAIADAAPAAVPAAPRVARYLVVPENIALQADSSFAAVRQPAPQPALRSGVPGVQPLPTTGAQQPAKQPAQRASQPRRGTSAAAGAGGQRPGSRQPEDQQPRRGSMFPNIAAGIETIDAEVGAMRRNRSGQATQPTTSRPQY